MRITTGTLFIVFAFLLGYIDGVHREDAVALPAKEFVNFGPQSSISLAIKGVTYIEYGEFHVASSSHLDYWPVYRKGDLIVGPDRAYMNIVDSGLPLEPIRSAQHFTAHLPIVRHNEKNQKNPESVCFITHGEHTYYAKLSTYVPPASDSASRVSVIGEFRKKVYYLNGVIKVWDHNKLPPAWVKRGQKSHLSA